MSKSDRSVTRDFTVSREFMDSVRATLPACVVCGKPSGYVDLEGRASHMVCSGESSEERLNSKLESRGGKIAADAGARDLGVVVREAAENAEGPRHALSETRSPEQLRAERAETMAWLHRNDRPARRSPELISRMREADVYDLRSIRTDPMNRDALRGELVDRARRAVDLGRYPTASRDQERVQAHIDDLLQRNDSESWNGSEVARRILTTGSGSYRSAFCKIMISKYRGSMIMLTPEEQFAVQAERALAVGVGNTGGFAVPFQLDPTVIQSNSGSRSPFRQICRVETISGTNEYRVITSAGMTASYATEASVTSDNSPTLAQPPLIVKQARAFAPVSLELEQDWGGILDQLGALVQSAKDDLEATKFSVGTGANEPEGIVVGATTGITSTTGAFDLASDLYPVELALPPRFRPNAVWIANRAQYQLIRQFVQPETSAPIIAHVPGGPTEVINYPAYESSGMTATAASGQKVMILVDPSYYLIVDRIGLDLEVTTNLYQQTTMGTGFGLPVGQKGILALWRNHAKLVDANAARVLQVA
jgi:HK97 family phage major capsid protein